MEEYAKKYSSMYLQKKNVYILKASRENRFMFVKTVYEKVRL